MSRRLWMLVVPPKRPVPLAVVNRAKNIDGRHVPLRLLDVRAADVFVILWRVEVARVAEHDDGDDAVLPRAIDHRADAFQVAVIDGILLGLRLRFVEILVAERQADDHVARVDGHQVTRLRIRRPLGREARHQRSGVVAAPRLVQHLPAALRHQRAQQAGVAVAGEFVAAAVRDGGAEHRNPVRMEASRLSGADDLYEGNEAEDCDQSSAHTMLLMWRVRKDPPYTSDW